MFTTPLAGAAPICHGARMTGSGRYRQAGGAVLAIAIIAGAVAGTVVGQPSIGFLVGAAAGILLAILIWLNDRRKD
jgi:hypothetical protein